MGRINTNEERRSTLNWAKNFSLDPIKLKPDWSIGSLRFEFEKSLKNYFRLCALGRGKSAPQKLSQEAHRQLFRVRIIIEKNIQESVLSALQRDPGSINKLFKGRFYGNSKKQGVSLRLPLTSCVPTPLCRGGCYAHDTLDASPSAVVRGAVNGVIASLYENGNSIQRAMILESLRAHSKRAIHAARSEIQYLSGWQRRPYVRFAHLGEAATFPEFMNALANQIGELSNWEVDRVVYTRHPNASSLKENLWITNFTLDKVSKERRIWAPAHARIVYSAWDGEIENDVDINFLEHHRWQHSNPSGDGPVCPATLPETEFRTCDSLRCDTCFRKKTS